MYLVLYLNIKICFQTSETFVFVSDTWIPINGDSLICNQSSGKISYPVSGVPQLWADMFCTVDEKHSFA